MSKRKAYGGVLINDRGEVLLREPTNHFNGYVWTWPKGQPDEGDSPETCALREVLEETGYQAEIIAPLPGVFVSRETENRYYLMRPVCQAQRPDWETAQIRWVSFEQARKLLELTPNERGRQRDLAVLAAVEQWLAEHRNVPTTSV